MICIIDDEQVVRDGLAWLCASRGLEARCYADGGAFLEACDGGLPLHQEPSCILVDIRMPVLSGLELYDLLRQRGLSPPAAVIFLTGHGDIAMAVQMLKKGAFDFIEKPFSDNDLVDRLMEGVALSEEHLSGRRLDAPVLGVREQLLATLSRRERQVMDRVLQGQLNKVIASDLNVSMRTVELHRSRVFAKMGVKSAVQLLLLLGQ